jgi:outer membrane protein assembly factor BamA
LRGYEEAAFFGPDVVVSNLELRSRPLQILSVQLAGVVFWDAGDAFDGFDRFELKHGVGFGLRFLAPQIDRAVFRIDAGFPVDPSVPGAATTVIAQFDQAFPVPSLQSLVP